MRCRPAATRRRPASLAPSRSTPNGTYTYTLTSPFDTTPDADNGANTEVAESFSYVVTDANGNTATGTITVNIVDDVPTAIGEHQQRGRGRASSPATC